MKSCSPYDRHDGESIMYLMRVGQSGFISMSGLQDEKAGMLFKRMIIGWLESSLDQVAFLTQSAVYPEDMKSEICVHLQDRSTA